MPSVGWINATGQFDSKEKSIGSGAIGSFDLAVGVGVGQGQFSRGETPPNPFGMIYP
jgi:hypothetical protein